MLEAQGLADRLATVPEEEEFTGDVTLAALAKEIATYRDHLQRLLREHADQFVLIKGADIAGIFPDRSTALREGYRRFGVVSFLVRQIVDPEPVVSVRTFSQHVASHTTAVSVG